jgi:hypothetical protein
VVQVNISGKGVLFNGMDHSIHSLYYRLSDSRARWRWWAT